MSEAWKPKLRHERRREFVGSDAGRRRELLAFAETDEVIAPAVMRPDASTPALKRVEPARPVVVVLHVVFTRPQHLDRRASQLARDPRGLEHVVVGQTTTEAAADAKDVHLNVRQRNAEHRGHQAAPGLGRLARRPDLELAVLELRRAVLRLERRMAR